MSAEQHHGDPDLMTDNAVNKGIAVVFGFLSMVGALSSVLFIAPEMTKAQIENLQNIFGAPHGH